MKRFFTILISLAALMLIQGSGFAAVRTIPKDMTGGFFYLQNACPIEALPSCGIARVDLE